MSTIRYKCCECCKGPDGVDKDSHAEFGTDWHEAGCNACRDWRVATTSTEGEDR